MKQDMPCASCGRLMYRNPSASLPEGQATCHPCRRKAAGRAPDERRNLEPKRRRVGWQVCATCGTPFETRQHNQRYCRPTCRPKTGSHYKPASVTERGYGSAHQRLRRQWKPKVEAGQAACSICGGWIEPGTPWDLDHEPGTLDQYRGPAHRRCNQSDGGKRGSGWRGLPVEAKACEACGAGFSTRYPMQRYCSRECRPIRQAAKR